MPHCVELFKVERRLRGTDVLAGPCVVSMAAARLYCTAVSPIDMKFTQLVHIKVLHLKSAPATFVRSSVARLDPSSWLQSLR